jgi:hypothetical protein
MTAWLGLGKLASNGGGRGSGGSAGWRYCSVRVVQGPPLRRHSQSAPLLQRCQPAHTPLLSVSGSSCRTPSASAQPLSDGSTLTSKVRRHQCRWPVEQTDEHPEDEGHSHKGTGHKHLLLRYQATVRQQPVRVPDQEDPPGDRGKRHPTEKTAPQWATPEPPCRRPVAVLCLAPPHDWQVLRRQDRPKQAECNYNELPGRRDH